MHATRSRPPDLVLGHGLGDARLMELVVGGDRAALGVLYARHGAFVQGLARRLTSPTQASDVTQEVFLGLWNRPARFDSTRGSLRTFLGQQARGRAIDLLRAESRRAAREGVAGAQAPVCCDSAETGAIVAIAGADTRRALGRLRGPEREAIVLAYFGCYPYKRVAELLGVPEGTIKTRIRSGLARLRVELLAR